MTRVGKMIGEVLGNLARRPATISYPAGKVTMPPNFRGKLVFHSARCVGCRLCVRDCPSQAIDIQKRDDGGFDAFVRLDRCIYCAQCADSCLKGALESTPEFELATMDKASLRARINVDDRAP